ncbi:MAG: CPBP family intramembrane metalloprotease [Methylobacter sp.]|uniref:CPBP family intramembrane glutamic endopeptidase n=1 Tax=Methylobacter sp. TaxID=2051955 RepID=UPI00272FBC7D|nr:CPBP family intramembrane glutamic endopeptidase [Methylobacter sp.]MDP1666378.1 CPBP family intramembrane metalloprotease [Methylobacter sp.]
MIKKIIYSIVPLLVLLSAASIACIVGYFIFQGIDGRLPLSKIITKSTQLFLVLSIFPAMAYLKFNKGDLGFVTKAVFLKQVLLGFGLGFVTLMPVFIAQYALGINIIDEAQQWSVGLVVEKMVISLLVALLVSMIEEPIFRGVLFAGLKKNLPVVAVILLSSTYYAALHFLDSHSEIPFQQAGILSGFTLLGEAFANLLNPEILSAFLALLMVGIFLGVLRAEVKQSLGLCIGCHTSWVWQIKMSKSLFNTDSSSEYFYLVSTYDGVVGPLVAGWLSLAIIGYFIYKKVQG